MTPKILMMNGVSSSTSVNSALSVAQTDNSPASLIMLKKALQGQQNEAAQLLQLIDGKGKIVDIQA